jgi:hypothetical protein
VKTKAAELSRGAVASRPAHSATVATTCHASEAVVSAANSSWLTQLSVAWIWRAQRRELRASARGAREGLAPRRPPLCVSLGCPDALRRSSRAPPGPSPLPSSPPAAAPADPLILPAFSSAPSAVPFVLLPTSSCASRMPSTARRGSATPWPRPPVASVTVDATACASAYSSPAVKATCAVLEGAGRLWAAAGGPSGRPGPTRSGCGGPSMPRSPGVGATWPSRLSQPLSQHSSSRQRGGASAKEK